LIDGFPRSLDQALYFEQKVMEIKMILHFHAREEVLFSRIKGNKLKIRNFQEQIQLLAF
jgi:adenylate kinase family enzyme